MNESNDVTDIGPLLIFIRVTDAAFTFNGEAAAM
jgi:hypothetical protein